MDILEIVLFQILNHYGYTEEYIVKYMVSIDYCLKGFYIEDLFKTNKVYLFKNKTYDTNLPSHFHIALSTKDSKYIVLSMITSQVDNKIKYYNLINKDLLESVLPISNNDINIIDKTA